MTETTNTSAAYQIFSSILTALSVVEKKVFLLNRPKQIDDKVSHFIVVDIPNHIKPTIISQANSQYRSNGLLYCFYRAKSDGTPYIDAQTRYIQKIMELFPVNDEKCVLTDARDIMRGVDEYGFQLVTISFRIRTKMNAI